MRKHTFAQETWNWMDASFCIFGIIHLPWFWETFHSVSSQFALKRFETHFVSKRFKKKFVHTIRFETFHEVFPLLRFETFVRIWKLHQTVQNVSTWLKKATCWKRFETFRLFCCGNLFKNCFKTFPESCFELLLQSQSQLFSFENN